MRFRIGCVGSIPLAALPQKVAPEYRQNSGDIPAYYRTGLYLHSSTLAGGIRCERIINAPVLLLEQHMRRDLPAVLPNTADLTAYIRL